MNRTECESFVEKEKASSFFTATFPRILLGPEASFQAQVASSIEKHMNKAPCGVTDKIKNPTVSSTKNLHTNKGLIMIYIGMDVSSKELVIYAVNDKKKVLLKSIKIAPSKIGLKKMLDGLGKQQKLVVFEAGNQMKWIALYLKKRSDVHLHIVHPNEIKWINQSSKKTDKVDAKKMAELARIDGLPRKVHVVEGSIRDLRELISARENLMRKRVDLINSIRGYMKQEGVGLPAKFFQSKDWQERLGKIPVGRIQKVIIKNFMYALDQMVLAEEGLLEEIYKIEDPRLELLESIPAIGKMSARVILSALDDVNRFDDKKAVAKYGALTPRIYQSGNVTQMGRIGNDGRKELRRVLLQCSHTLNRMSKNHAAKPLYDFSQKIGRKRNKKIAAVATSRKLLTVAYGVLKNGEFYDPRNLKPNKAA